MVVVAGGCWVVGAPRCCSEPEVAGLTGIRTLRPAAAIAVLMGSEGENELGAEVAMLVSANRLALLRSGGAKGLALPAAASVVSSNEPLVVGALVEGVEVAVELAVELAVEVAVEAPVEAALAGESPEAASDAKVLVRPDFSGAEVEVELGLKLELELELEGEPTKVKPSFAA